MNIDMFKNEYKKQYDRVVDELLHLLKNETPESTLEALEVVISGILFNTFPKEEWEDQLEHMIKCIKEHLNNIKKFHEEKKKDK